nr:PREDICTED: testis-expressed sequence 12 protein [Anolis carolinensis]|eukprot:XP_008121887.1 PREDICTED: testis-expressed sequence 12 protein [Anolis carolinensis]
MTSNPAASEGQKSKRKKEAQNEASEKTPLSSLEKKEASLSEASPAQPQSESLDTVLNDTSKEINALLSKYAHILSEKAATDASYVEELDGIIKEASSIEHHLISKRENVRHRLCMIGGPVQSENASTGK